MAYRIRKMALSDYETAIALWRSLPGIGLDKESDSPCGIAALLRRNPGLSLVACEKNVLVGTVLVGHDGRRGFLYHLAVAPTHRKLGIGEALVSRALDSLSKMHIPKCSIFLIRSNSAGLAFWEHIGWSLRDDLRVLQKTLPNACALTR